MTVQVHRAVDAAGIKGSTGCVVAEQNNCFAACRLRLEGFLHGVVEGFADLGKVSLRHTEGAVSVRGNGRVLDHILGRVVRERTAGDLDGCHILAGSGRIIIEFCTKRTVDRAAGNGNTCLLASTAVIADGFNVSVDRAAADRERGV